MVAVDLLLGQQPGETPPDVVVAIVDASNLERNLYLTCQVLELGAPVVVALNMGDVAAAQGVRIDADRLAGQLGVPVVPIQANKGLGLEPLRQAIDRAVEERGAKREQRPADLDPRSSILDPRPRFPEAFEREADALQAVVGQAVPRFLVRRILLDVGGHTEERLGERHPALRTLLPEARQRLAEAGCPLPAVEARVRWGWVRQATAGCVHRPQQRPVTWTDRIDRVLTHRVAGTLVFLAVMFLVFQAIFTGARPLMDGIAAGKDALAGFLRGVLPAGPLASLATDGVLEGVGGVLVFLPQILILFGFIALLEDSGYLARAAFLMDRLMARCGLSGKSFIPLLSSLACAVPGIMAARVIEDRRDRLATILVAPLMSCSARLPVYTLLIGAFLTEGYAPWFPGLVLFALYLLGLIAAPLVALALKRTLLRGETPVFVLEMPLYKVPSPRAVLRRMADNAGAFVRRAGTVILASMIVVWALLYFPTADPEGRSYPGQIAQTEASAAGPKQELAELTGREDPADPERIERLEAEVAAAEERVNDLGGAWKRNSFLGQAGRALAPVVRPLGWDWKIGMAALASFPAREVVVGTLGIIYNLGSVDPGEITAEHAAATSLGRALQAATWEDDPARKVFTVPTALSLMVFFALCCQCASTLAVIRRETGGWGWPVFTFVYMTTLAYLGALLVYQVGSRLA